MHSYNIVTDKKYKGTYRCTKRNVQLSAKAIEDIKTKELLAKAGKKSNQFNTVDALFKDLEN